MTTSATEWRDLARRVEDLGYSTLFVSDHYLGDGPAMRRARLFPHHVAPIAAMATAAAHTTTLRIGCRVFCIDYHVPAALVKEAATIDLLSDGRLELGIGAGWSEHEYAAMGLSFGAPADRVDKLEEVVALFKAHCTGTQLEIDGRHVTAKGYAALPLPVQRPHPPVMIRGHTAVPGHLNHGRQRDTLVGQRAEGAPPGAARRGAGGRRCDRRGPGPARRQRLDRAGQRHRRPAPTASSCPPWSRRSRTGCGTSLQARDLARRSHAPGSGARSGRWLVARGAVLGGGPAG